MGVQYANCRTCHGSCTGNKGPRHRRRSCPPGKDLKAELREHHNIRGSRWHTLIPSEIFANPPTKSSIPGIILRDQRAATRREINPIMIFDSDLSPRRGRCKHTRYHDYNHKLWDGSPRMKAKTPIVTVIISKRCSIVVRVLWRLKTYAEAESSSPFPTPGRTVVTITKNILKNLV